MEIRDWANDINKRYRDEDTKSQAKKELQSLKPKERKILLAWLESKDSLSPEKETKLTNRIKVLNKKEHHHKKSFLQSTRIKFSAFFNKDLQSDRLLEKIDNHFDPKQVQTLIKKPVEKIKGPPLLNELLALPEEILYQIVHTTSLGKNLDDTIKIMRVLWGHGDETVLKGINAKLFAKWMNEYKPSLTEIPLSLKDHEILIPKLQHLNLAYWHGKFNKNHKSLPTDLSLKKIAELKNLTSLDFSYCQITDVGLAYLKGMKLTALDLSGCSDITNAGLAYLKGMNLTFLDLGDCSNVTDAGLAYLKGMPLTSLDLTKCYNSTDAGLAYLKGMPLTSLDLAWGIQITNDGLKNLKNIPLTSLNLLYCNQITDASLPYLKYMPLTSLELDGCNQITDTGLACFKGMKLTFLNLGGCRNVTDAGLQNLNKTLTSLNLSYCRQITDAGLAYLKGMPLTSLNLYACHQITKAGLKNFKKNHPNCKIRK